MRALLTAVVVLALIGVVESRAAVPSGNLLRDPGAEQGLYGEWTTANGFVLETYGAEFRPPQSASNAIDGGANLFAGGSEADTSSATQLVDVTEAAAEIDAGQLTATLSAFLGGIDDEGDYAVVAADFLGQGEIPLATVTIGPVTAADRGNQTALLPRSGQTVVPAGTRRIRVTITATRLVGIYTDGYADNLSLTLRQTSGPSPTPTPTPPSTVKGSVGGIKSPGRRIRSRITAKAPCKTGRSVVIKKGSKTVGSGRTKNNGSFNIKTKKHKKGKLVIKVRRRTTAGTICAPLSKSVPGRN